MPPRGNTDLPDQPVVVEERADTVRLAVGHPYDELVLHDSDGKPIGVVITADGTDVPAGDEETVRTAAKDAGVPIRKVR